MSFRADCPPSYQPSGFRSADNHSIAPGDWKSLWSGELNPVTTFEAAYHVVQIAARNKEYEEQTASQLHDTLMSKQLHYMQRTSSNRNVGLLSTLPVHATPLRNTETLEDIPVKRQSKRARGDSASDHNKTPPVEEAVKTSEAKPSPRRRRISISARFIELNRSSPASGMSLDHDGLDTYASRQADRTDQSEEDFN
jgi:hypothetical protein